MSWKAGFTLTECVVVLAIIMIVSGLSLPSISRTLDYATLNSAAEQVASLYEQARMRATQDDTYYDLVTPPAGAAQAQLCLDLDGDGFCGNTEPQAHLPSKVILSNSGIPAPLTAAALGFTPLQTEASATFSQQGNQVAGLAWNARGLPCQRVSPTSSCSNLLGAGPVTWIQYLQLRRGPNDVLYAAVTVNPSGRIRIWKYAPGTGGASWY